MPDQLNQDIGALKHFMESSAEWQVRMDERLLEIHTSVTKTGSAVAQIDILNTRQAELDHRQDKLEADFEGWKGHMKIGGAIIGGLAVIVAAVIKFFGGGE